MKIPYQISLNQIVEFSAASAAKRIAIARQQVVVNPFLVPWYQLAKNRIKKYFHNTRSNDEILEAIEILKRRVPASTRQKTDRQVSIEALHRILAMRIPAFLKNLDYEVVKVGPKSMMIGSVAVNINPDVVIRAKIDGKWVYGGLKIHLSKHKPFDLSQCYHVAAMVHTFLSKEAAGEDDIVSPELCFCLDVFGGRLVSSPMDYSLQSREMENFCEEFKEVWNQVNLV